RAAVFLLLNTYLVYSLAVRYQDRPLFKRLLWVTYAVSILAAVYGIAQYFGTEWFWPHNLNPYGSRPVSTFGNPNFMSSFLVLVIPVMMADFVTKATGMPRVILFVGVALTTAVPLATLTRSSWVGLLVGMLLVLAGGWRAPGFQKNVG